MIDGIRFREQAYTHRYAETLEGDGSLCESEAGFQGERRVCHAVRASTCGFYCGSGVVSSGVVYPRLGPGGGASQCWRWQRGNSERSPG